MQLNKLLTAIFLLVLPAVIFSQMPSWKFFKDREGNTYYIDSAGKIYITSLPQSNRKVVSADGIDYYISFGEELLSRRKTADALIIFKSILALPDKNSRIYNARVRAAKNIDAIRKNNGDRFEKLNTESSLLFFKTGEKINIANDYMKFSFYSRGNIRLIRFKSRPEKDEKYQGASIGLVFSDKAGADNKFEAIASVDSVIKNYTVNSLEETVENWKIVRGTDTLVRSELLKTRDTLINEFSSGIINESGAVYKGFEVQKFSGSSIYYFRIISSAEKFDLFKDRMRETALSFKTVSKPDYLPE